MIKGVEHSRPTNARPRRSFHATHGHCAQNTLDICHRCVKLSFTLMSGLCLLFLGFLQNVCLNKRVNGFHCPLLTPSDWFPRVQSSIQIKLLLRCRHALTDYLHARELSHGYLANTHFADIPRRLFWFRPMLVIVGHSILDIAGDLKDPAFSIRLCLDEYGMMIAGQTGFGNLVNVV